MPLHRRSLVALLASALAGCGCASVVQDSMEVTVTKADSGQRVCDAQVAAVDGDFREVLLPEGSADRCTYLFRRERAGKYQVSASRAGFQPAAPQRVTVSRGLCGVMTVQVALQLSR